MVECNEEEPTPGLINCNQDLKAYVNEFSNFKGSGIDVETIDDEQGIQKYLVRIDFSVTNDVVEYEATIFGMITSRKLGTEELVWYNDSRFMVNQYARIFETKENKMRKYIERLNHECSSLENFKIKQISYNNNCQRP